MNKLRILTLGLILGLVVISSCKKDDDEIINEAEVLAEYLETDNFINTEAPAIIKADAVLAANATGDIYIIDIRAAADYELGHIENAHNVALGDLLTHYESNNLSNEETVAIVCYSGQSAAYGASLLRLAGYDNVKSMKWGMCSWNEFFAGSWPNAVENGNAYATDMTTDLTDKAAEGDLPALTTNYTDPVEILNARLTTVFSEGYTPAKILNADVFANPSNYYIVNYWKTAHYEVDHIPGAIQYTPKESWTLAADLKTLPTDQPIVVYCYTGQTSSYVAAFLRVLGYDAKSLLFGANGMMYDTMAEQGDMTIWTENEIHDYDYETGTK